MSDKPEKHIIDDDHGEEIEKSQEHAESVKELSTEKRPDSCVSGKQSDQVDLAAKENSEIEQPSKANISVSIDVLEELQRKSALSALSKNSRSNTRKTEKKSSCVNSERSKKSSVVKEENK